MLNDRPSLSTSEVGCEPPSSPPQISALRFHEKIVATKATIMELEEEKQIIPSSQSQYLHYSQKQAFPSPSLTTATLEPECIPSSQSQLTIYSPRKVKKPPPLSTKSHELMGLQGLLKTKSSFVVPSSQEDEIEISLPEDVCWLNASQDLKASFRCKRNQPGDHMYEQISYLQGLSVY